VEERSWTDEIRAGDVVLAIHYFGIPLTTFPAERVKARGALLVEDASQALFLPQQFPESTCIVYSPRKFLGVPDGGILVAGDETGTESIPLREPPAAWWRAAVAMSMKRRDFDGSGQENDWHSLFQRVEAEYPVGLYRASDLSRMLICSADYGSIGRRRRANYARLFHLLGEYAVITQEHRVAVPCGFPVRVGCAWREGVAGHLHSRKMFVPVHWRLAGEVPEEFRASHELSSGCLTLVCDQRFTPADMDLQAGEFRAALVGMGTPDETTSRGRKGADA
jgi:hypothetical protein